MAAISRFSAIMRSEGGVVHHLERSTATDTPRGRVVVVTADEPTGEAMRRSLTQAGFDACVAIDRADALEAAREIDAEVVLADHAAGPGLETCEAFRSDSEVGHAPIVFFASTLVREVEIVDALEAGAADFIGPPMSAAVLVARLERQIATTRTQMRLRQLAMTDELTGAYSRRFLFQTLRLALRAGVRSNGTKLACLMLDIDRFKSVNDTRGHRAGDRVLVEVADAIRCCVRDIDTFARYGGDEFTVLLPDTDLSVARTVAERIRARVDSLGGPATVSVGAAGMRLDSTRAPTSDARIDAQVERLLGMADAALYKAKRDGRNCVACQPV